jgi:hypothetical protein
MMKTLALVLFFVFAASSALALHSVPGKQIVTLTATPGPFSEPAIAIDPAHPLRVVAAYQVLGNVAYSRDAGRSWHRVVAVPHDHRLIDGDVSLAFDARGAAVLCYIAFDKLGTETYWAHDATRNGIFVLRSPDGGEHWQRHAIAVMAPAGHPGIFEDKPYVIADDTAGPYRGHLYIGWTEFHLGFSQMLFARSTDGGATWSRPMRISTVNGLPRDDNGAVEGFDAAVASDGTLYSVWQDGTHILLAISRDGGRSFEPSRPILGVPSMNFSITGYLGRGGNGFPQIAIDPRSNRLFVTWSDFRNGEVDVFSATSTDGGATWSAPVKVNDDPIHDGRDHLFQWLAVDPTSGDAYVIFKDRRGDANNERETVTLARSSDAGRSYRNYAWTSTSDDPLGQFMGDYNGIAAYGGRVYGAWTEAAPTPARPYTKGWLRSRTIVRLGIAQF